MEKGIFEEYTRGKGEEGSRNGFLQKGGKFMEGSLCRQAVLAFLHQYWKEHCTTLSPGPAPCPGLSKPLAWQADGEAAGPAPVPDSRTLSSQTSPDLSDSTERFRFVNYSWHFL